MSKVQHLTATDNDAGQRLDNFLIRVLSDVPRSLIYRIVRKGEVRVNKGRVRPHYRLQSGDVVRIPPVDRGEPGHARQPPAHLAAALENAVIEESSDWLVIDKPAGMAVHAGSGIEFGMIEILRSARSHGSSLELVHRLDRETSGCLLVARKRSALRVLHRDFREGRVTKRYLALVKGKWDLGAKCIDAPLATHTRRDGERTVTVAPDGKPAKTHFRPVTFYPGATLLEAQPETGRTHQIRVHAAWAGHPIAGDARYGDADFNRECASGGLRRMFLHAHMLEFQSPGSAESTLVSAPLPRELGEYLESVATRGRTAVRRRRQGT